MAKPQTLRTIEDYCPALLWLMGQLKRAQKWDALAEFERELGTLIPTEHRQESSSGRIWWRDYYVSRARRNLIRAGLMGGRGIWTITSAGQQWLAEHPDGGGEELKALIRSVKTRQKPSDTSEQRAPGQAARSRARRVADLDRPVEFTVAGHRFSMSGRQVLEQARQALVDGIPPEALRYRNWVVDVDGQPVGVKWLFRLATGLRHFHTGDARRILPRLGIEVRSLGQAPAPMMYPVPTQVPQSDEMSRQEFLDLVAQAVHAELPPHLTPSAVRNRGNYLQIAYPEFRISHLHYEVYLLKSRHEVALHFESAPEINLAWLEHFKSEVAQLSQLLGHPVQAERWGRKSARVGMPFSPRPLTAALAQEMGALMAWFIQATYPIMREALAAEPLPALARKRRRKKPTDNAERRYRLLDAEVHTIRDFLGGHSDGRPSDERLCYWVYLCLTFELHREGWQLFTLIDPSQVSKTLYERTNRFAQACHIRAEVQT